MKQSRVSRFTNVYSCLSVSEVVYNINWIYVVHNSCKHTVNQLIASKCQNYEFCKLLTFWHILIFFVHFWLILRAQKETPFVKQFAIDNTKKYPLGLDSTFRKVLVLFFVTIFIENWIFVYHWENYEIKNIFIFWKKNMIFLAKNGIET